MDESPIYYRIYARKNNTGSITGLEITTMQWFDEYDYNQDNFFTQEKFDTEELAQAYIDKQILNAVKLKGMVHGN